MVPLSITSFGVAFLDFNAHVSLAVADLRMGHYLAIGCTAHILQKLHILHYSVILSFRSLILCIL